ncbi:MAG: type IX secretion system plug protein domain-containing protein [Bacteroidota bacterium]
MRVLPTILFSLLSLLLFSGCASQSASNENESASSNTTKRISAFQTPDFFVNRTNYSGWQYEGKYAYGMPVIVLESKQQISLSFTYWGTDAKQFKANLIHYTPSWTPSNVPQTRYLKGTFEDYFGGGRSSQNTNVSYRRYNYQFPTEQQVPIISGNYMIEIRDYDTNNLVARLPFLVTENEGELKTNIETLYNAGPNREPRYQPFSTFTYPPFVEFPRMDLHYYYQPIPFWGKTQQVKIVDYLTEGESRFHLSRSNSLFAPLMRTINLINPQTNGQTIDEVMPEAGGKPTKVLLDPDEVNLEAPTRHPRPTIFGQSTDQRTHDLLEVTFRLLAPSPENQAEIYLVGNYDGWQLPDQPMKLNAQTGYLEHTVQLTEGEYQYQYVRRINGETIPVGGVFSYADIIPPVASLVYFNDPEKYIYRLLNVNIVP